MYNWQKEEKERNRKAFREEATLQDGIYRWGCSGNIVPDDILADNDVSPGIRIACNKARDQEIKDLVAKMRATKLSPEDQAEQDFEARAAFGRGTTVVNVFTGKKRKL